MKLRVLLVAALLLVACAVRADAQTISSKVTWSMVEPPAVAQAFTYTLRQGATIVPIGAVTCVAGALTSCSASVTQTTPLTPGSYTLTGSNAFGPGVPSDPYVGSAPSKPGSFSFTFTFTFTP